MSDNPNITIPVDLTNPGQFFACCGLLELADRLWPGAQGWFERRQFCIAVSKCGRKNCTLPRRNDSALACMPEDGASRNLVSAMLAEANGLQFDVGGDDDSESEDSQENSGPVQPIDLRWCDDRLAIRLDWWEDRSIKPWAGSMKERVILRAMLSAIDPANDDPFNDLRRVQYQSPRLDKRGKPLKPKKKEPFYFDPRRGNKSHPLDCGFSPDTHGMEAECCPALEALCFIGLQRARPSPTGVPNQSRYTVWPRLSLVDPGITANLVGAVTCGFLRLPGSSTYIFDNYFRTDHRKHKTFSQATLERSTHA